VSAKIPLADLIVGAELDILGVQNWLDRAARKEIKRPDHAIEDMRNKRARLEATLAALRFLQKHDAAIRAALTKK
jgi:hypothetical protein